MHPDSFASRRDNTGSAEISQVPANLWLIRFQYLHEKTDTDLLIAYEVDDPQARGIRQCPKEQLAIEWFLFPCHNEVIVT
jgi:hypothetical protein